MSSGAADTIDSLFTFKYNKKKFSFANRNLSNGDGTSIEKKESSESDYEKETIKDKAGYKGSAKLKSSKKSSSSNSEDSSDESTKKKKKKKKKLDANYSDEDRNVQNYNKELKKLFGLFPKIKKNKIRSLFIKSSYDAKNCIDLLLEEDDDGAKPEEIIEEWSDGDERIKLQNKKAKDASNLNGRKRKLSSDEETDLKKITKKSRRVIIESDGDEKNSDNIEECTKHVDKDVAKQQNRSESLNSSNDSEDKKSKKSTKNKAIYSDDDEESKSSLGQGEDDNDDKKKTKSHKKSHKKDKKKKKKKKKDAIGSNSDNDNDHEDTDFSDNGNGGSSDSDDSEKCNWSDKVKADVLKVLNTSSVQEIQSMLNSATKKADILVSMRPFKSFPDLKARLKEKAMSQFLISIKDVLDAREQVNDLFTKCEKISKRMEKQVESLIKSDEACSSKPNSNKLEIKSQPSNLNNALSLKPYQLIGLNWLCLMHKESINGILADEMGLGKTCQTIAFLAHLLQTEARIVHLIVVPPSTLDNWVREISTWCPDFYFTVYQGSIDDRRVQRFNILNEKFEKPLNGILTTYGMLISTNDDKAFFKKLNLGYVIFDEAHMLKNMHSLRYQGLIKIKSKGKLLLTGTPLQNNLVELMSLLYFVMPDIFHHKTDHINKIFKTKNDNDSFYSSKIEQAKGIMKPFILRRVKADVLKQLPKKIEEIIYCDMTQRQAKEYKDLISFYKQRKDDLMKEIEEKAKLKGEAKVVVSTSNVYAHAQEIIELTGGDHIGSKNCRKNNGEKKENGDSSSNIIMELRKSANHALLRRTIYNDEKIKQMAKLIMKESSPDTVLEYVIEDMSVLNDFQIHKLCSLYKCLKGFELPDETILDSGKITILNSLLEEKKEMGQRVLVFSQFVIALDILEEYLKIKKYKYLRLDGNTVINERQDMIDCFNHDSSIFVFLISTRAGGMGINLTAANVVILYDIDYNPYNDKQAEDRCHRVGQTKEVQVYKLLSKNTIDETMLKIQQKKINLGLDISGEKDENHTKVDMVSLLKEALKF